MGVRDWLGKMFDPNKSAEELAMNVIIKGGYLGERIDVVETIGDPEKTKAVWGGAHNKITLPWLDIANKRDNFDRVDAFQELLNIIDYVKEEKSPPITELNKKESTQENSKEIETKIEPVKNKGIGEATTKINRIARQCGTLVVGFSMSDPEDMKNVILSKPIFVTGTGSTILPAGDDGEKPKRVAGY